MNDFTTRRDIFLNEDTFDEITYIFNFYNIIKTVVLQFLYLIKKKISMSAIKVTCHLGTHFEHNEKVRT